MKLDGLPKPKDRHIVTWSPQEDDMLRQQICAHGTDSWTAIAATFKDKTSRQCRRRWFTYLHTECKKGGWSPEEDMLLCEAQKIFGNRWTEIAKVVSGRTDNAVKNRFSTLCKKQAKLEALARNREYINLNNKRIISHDAISESDVSNKRVHVLGSTENLIIKGRSLDECPKHKQLPRPPLSDLLQNSSNMCNPYANPPVINSDGTFFGPRIHDKKQGELLRKGDSKIVAMMQQQEDLFSVFASRTGPSGCSQSLENAWKDIPSCTVQKEHELLGNKRSSLTIAEDSRVSLGGTGSSRSTHITRSQPDLEESQGSSEYGLDSNRQANDISGQKELNHKLYCSLEQHLKADIDKNTRELGNSLVQSDEFVTSEVTFIDTPKDDEKRDTVLLATTEASSPVHMIPPFKTVAEGSPSPSFSESERRFLMRTFCLTSHSSESLSSIASCRKALVDSL